MRGRIATQVRLLTLTAVVAALWSFPLFAFPHPGPNEAIQLSNLELPLLGAMILASVVGLRMAWKRRHAASGSVALGTYLLGVAAVFVLLLVTVGNLSNDRFLPLLFFPFVFAPAGGIILLLALVMPGRRRGDVRRGVTRAGLALVLLTAWGVGRGARDWLLAPYGFDILLFIALEAALLFLFADGMPEARKPTLRDSDHR